MAGGHAWLEEACVAGGVHGWGWLAGGGHAWLGRGGGGVATPVRLASGRYASYWNADFLGCYFFILMVQKSKRTHLSETVISKQNLFSIVSDARLVQDNRFISTVSIGPCQGVKILYLMRSKKIA